MQVTVLYVGSSLLAPLKAAELEINRLYQLELKVAAHNFGSPLTDLEWEIVEQDLARTDVVFIIHVMDGENASRLLQTLEHHGAHHKAVVVINCMPELMRRTRMGRLDFARRESEDTTRIDQETARGGKREGESRDGKTIRNSREALNLLGTIGSWIGKQAKRDAAKKVGVHTDYLKLVEMLPRFLRLVPTTGRLRDIKNYLFLFCYFLQPTPANIRGMLLFALKHYVLHQQLRKIKVSLPESTPAVAIYHPQASRLFESFEQYKDWYLRQSPQSKLPGQKASLLKPESTIGLLLMRPQVVSKTTKHYDALIGAIEAEGLSVIPALSTLMDNRQACEKFFVDDKAANGARRSGLAGKPGKGGKWNGTNVISPVPLLPCSPEVQNTEYKVQNLKSRVSQIVSLTGFSFVGGPAMNDSDAAAKFLIELNRPYRSAVSLDMQTIETWVDSQIGLNPVQTGMQIAIPEIDGATEPFVYGGIPARGFEPTPLEERCRRLARRLKRWQRLAVAPREELKLGFILFCFPPSKGNVGTAADLDVFPSVWDILKKLEAAGYRVDLPESSDALRDRLLHGNSDKFASAINVEYRMDVDEYRRLCPYVREVESEWGVAPGKINTFGKSLLIQGIRLGNVFIGVQPTFGYEGDPMRLMMAKSGAPHHGFLAFYSYLATVFAADALIHVGTHGALEFMPGKQVGLSEKCWPDRLIGELPNLYLYSVNNPSEGAIAKRRSYAELISYLTPPIENAGLYKELATLKELVMAYRQTDDEPEKERLFEAIEEYSSNLNLSEEF